jgi:hypothetical protein
MLAVANLFSDQLVSSSSWLDTHVRRIHVLIPVAQLDFSVDTSVTRSGRPYTDYRTRRIGMYNAVCLASIDAECFYFVDDDNFENTLIVIPNEAFSNRTEQMFANPDKVMSNKQTSKRNLTK